MFEPALGPLRRLVFPAVAPRIPARDRFQDLRSVPSGLIPVIRPIVTGMSSAVAAPGRRASPGGPWRPRATRATRAGGFDPDRLRRETCCARQSIAMPPFTCSVVPVT